jgi:rhodanese-related sulfurtransferase
MEIFIGAVVVIVVLFGIYLWYSKREKPQVRGHQKDISARHAYRLIQKNWKKDNFHIIDLRSPKEFNDGHILNAKNMFYWEDNFEEHVQAMEKEDSYLIYCKNGSATSLYPGNAYEVFEKYNFKNVYTIKRGYIEWKGEKFPLVKE